MSHRLCDSVWLNIPLSLALVTPQHHLILFTLQFEFPRLREPRAREQFGCHAYLFDDSVSQSTSRQDADSCTQNWSGRKEIMPTGTRVLEYSSFGLPGST